MSESPIIIALDLDSAEQARSLVAALGDRAGFYKVGLELYTAVGPQFVHELTSAGKQVFLDLKFYDIGETVKRAAAQAARAGARFLTVHAVPQVMRAAVEGRGDSALQILAVTVLTSLDENDLRAMGHTCSVPELVMSRVRQGVECGVDGFVCSPLEVRDVRSAAGPAKILVTPGVRSAGASAADQKRVATPRAALDNGANYLVIGRQVTRAANPAAELQNILAEIHGHSGS
jgi:orotidine-5'-phosphate decarboxylase